MTNYIFYIKDSKGKIIKTYSKFCIHPNKTKIGKQLKKLLNEQKINSFGWCIASKFNYNI